MSDRLAHIVYGHEQTTLMLSKAIISQNVPQSLLITGLPQLGKATLAQALAMAVNCQASSPPCRECGACRKISHGYHPDVLMLDTPQETLAIDQIRELQRDLALRPHESRYKVAILCNFERATLAAANALLKTLEEPPAHAMLILTTLDPTLLLPTIVSRCQIIPLRPIGEARLAEILQARWGASTAEAGLLSRLAYGRLGWAVRALTEPDLLNQRRQYLADLVQLIQAGHAFRLAYAASLANDDVPLVDILNLWLGWWRDVLLVGQGLSQAVINIDLLENLHWFARHLPVKQIVAAVQSNRTTLKNLHYNVNVRLNMEVFLLNLPFIPSSIRI